MPPKLLDENTAPNCSQVTYTLVDLTMLRMNFIAVWLIWLYEHLVENPFHMVNGFYAAGIARSTNAGQPITTCHNFDDNDDNDGDDTDEVDDDDNEVCSNNKADDDGRDDDTGDIDNNNDNVDTDSDGIDLDYDTDEAILLYT